MVCGVTSLVLTWMLGAGDPAIEPSGTLQQWEYGSATGGTPVWTTRLGANTFNDSTDNLDLTLPDVAELQRAVLVVAHATDLGVGDTARFLLDTGAGFVPVQPIGGYPGGATAFQGASQGTVRSGFDITGVPPDSVLRLQFQADASGSGPGWTLEGVELFDGDPLPPRIVSVSGPGDNQDLLGPHTVLATVDEDAQLTSVRVVYDTGAGESSADMVLDGNEWRGEIPAVPPDTPVAWRVEAEDCASAGAAVGTPFRVFLAAPTGLAGPAEPHTVDTSAVLTWTPPNSPWPIDGYVVEELSSGDLLDGPDPLQSVTLDPTWEQRFDVRARYDTPLGLLDGDRSAEVQLSVEIPTLASLSPTQGFPGEQLYVDVVGESLYLVQDLTLVRVLGGIETLAVDVRDIDRARVLLSIPDDVLPGFHDVEIGGAHGVFRFENQFEIVDGALAPAITRITPDSIVQGEELEIVFFASRAFEGPVRVIVDDDLIVASDPVVEADQVSVRLVAIGASRPGSHTIVLDDGRRLYTAELEIDEYRVDSRRRCSAVPSLPSGLCLVGITLIGIGRRRTIQGKIRPSRETP